MSKIKKSLPYVSGATYNIKILLTQECVDLGIFDVYDDPASTSVGTTDHVGQETIISGYTLNKLSRIRTFSQSSDLNLKYITSTTPTTNGLNLNQTSVTGSIDKYVYYIDGITYTTTITPSSEVTTFSYVSVFGDSALFENKPILKDEEKLRQIEKARIEPDVFIVRQNIPVLMDMYRISDVKNMEEIYQYGSGYFNIIDNF
jgi:hypothetical protein